MAVGSRFTRAVLIGALGLLLAAAIPRSASASVSSTQSIAWLNAQRADNGIPAGITDNPAWDPGCQHHIAWEEQNLGAANPHIETPGTPAYTDDGAFAGANSVLASGEDWSASKQYPWGEADPWETAPIHLMQLLGPDLAQTAWGDDGSHICMITWAGYGRPAPAAPQLLTYPANGTSFIYAQERADEWPFTPAAFVGLPQGGTTGPYLYVLGYGTGYGSISAASLSGPSGPVDVRTVDNTTTGPAGDLGSYLPPGGIIVPAQPLVPGATYTASVTFSPDRPDYMEDWSEASAPLSQTWSFTTAQQTGSGVTSRPTNGASATPLANSVRVSADPSGDTVKLTVSSDAANAHLTLTGPRRLAPSLNASGHATVTLGPGRWVACATSGGAGTGYEVGRGCTTVAIDGSPGLRLSAFRRARDRTYVVLTASSASIGQHARVAIRYYRERCIRQPVSARKWVRRCGYDRVAHTSRSVVALRARRILAIHRGWLARDRRLQVTVTTRRFKRGTVPYAAGKAQHSYCTIGTCESESHG